LAFITLSLSASDGPILNARKTRVHKGKRLF